MSADIRFVVETDPAFVELKEILARFELKLDAQGVNHTMAFAEIMATLDETVSTLQKIDADIDRLHAAVAALEAQIAALAASLTPEQQAALEAALANVKGQVQAIDDRTPEP